MFQRSDNEHDLRDRARAALHAGTLPRVSPHGMWGGHGNGDTCPVCGNSIKPAEVELELEFADPNGGPAVRTFHMHLPCFAAWENARKFAASSD